MSDSPAYQFCVYWGIVMPTFSTSQLELNDFWILSSDYISNTYLEMGVIKSAVFAALFMLLTLLY